MKIKAKDLLKGILKVDPAKSNKLFKPEIAGIYLHVEDGFLWAVATDGFILFKARVMPCDSAYSVIVSHPAVKELKETLKQKGSETIDITETITEAMTVTGQFPDYKSVIPQEFVESIHLTHEGVKNLLVELKEQYKAAKKHKATDYGVTLHNNGFNVYAIYGVKEATRVYGNSVASVMVDITFVIKALTQAKKSKEPVSIKLYDKDNRGAYILTVGDQFLLSGRSEQSRTT